jgi:hypothetical protein
MNWTAEKWCDRCGLEPTLVGPLPNAPTIELHRCFSCGTMYEFDTWTKSAKECSGATTH